eukprot:GHVP01058448.1.p1 GENE.GHVP01058448.1~~GHVP01058448.1.p1  ORF type:complete len:108 (-),score=2.76 GHVP01058448.1:503-826(-)
MDAAKPSGTVNIEYMGIPVPKITSPFIYHSETSNLGVTATNHDDLLFFLWSFCSTKFSSQNHATTLFNKNSLLHPNCALYCHFDAFYQQVLIISILALKCIKINIKC